MTAALTNPDSLFELLDQLRSNGFDLAVTHYIAVQDLLAALVARNVDLSDPRRLRQMLGPLLCSTPAEQETFGEYFDRWLASSTGLGRREDAQTHTDAAGKQDECQRAITSLRRKRRFLGMAVAGLAGLLSIVLAVWLVWNMAVVPDRSGSGATEGNARANVSWSVPLPVFLVASLGGFAGFLVWRKRVSRQLSEVLVRRTTPLMPRLERLLVQDTRGEIFSRDTMPSIARSFRQRVAVPSKRLDIDGTVKATVDAGGWFCPVYAQQQVPPEYLFLVDRVSVGDQHAQHANALIEQLRIRGVFLQRYYFQGAPLVCFPDRERNPPVRLIDLAAKFPHHRLIVCTEASRLFNSWSGNREPWIDNLKQWQHRVLVTPELPETWDRTHRDLERDFLLLPATTQGWSTLAASLRHGGSQRPVRLGWEYPLPIELESRPHLWLERSEPSSDLVERMMVSLRAYLGSVGLTWLAACAVFPALHRNLTLHLGHSLFGDEWGGAMDDRAFVRLSRLPWFRYGSMPDWLRLRLLLELTPGQEAQIRQVLDELLNQAYASPSDAESRQAVALEVAQEPGTQGESADQSELRDVIFREFVAERHVERLAVKLRKKVKGTSRPPSPTMEKLASAAQIRRGQWRRQRLWERIRRTLFGADAEGPAGQPASRTRWSYALAGAASLLVCVSLFGGGVYWWVNRETGDNTTDNGGDDLGANDRSRPSNDIDQRPPPYDGDRNTVPAELGNEPSKSFDDQSAAPDDSAAPAANQPLNPKSPQDAGAAKQSFPPNQDDPKADNRPKQPPESKPFPKEASKR